MTVKVEELHKTVIEVEKLIAQMLEQIRQLGKSMDALNDARAETVQGLNDLRRDSEKEVVALRKDVEELRRWADKVGTSEFKAQLDVLKEKVVKLEDARDKGSTRAWSVVPNIAGAVVNVVLAAVVALIVSRLAK